MKVVAFAGGVGGAKLADGLLRALPPEDLTIIVNTGDDFTHLGLRICPDLDTVCYTLAGLANPETGWGRASETYQVLQGIQTLGGPDWFRLGDRDIATHLERTRRLANGESLSQITESFCRSWRIACRVLPMSDDPIPTIVQTSEGELPFQEYFVHRRCDPVVSGFRFDGIEKSCPAPGVLEALLEAGLLIYCPSNPWVSIGPILAVPEIREAAVKRPAVAITPIIGGKAVKGPAAKMYTELGIQPSALAVARQYGFQGSGGVLSGFVLDQQDCDSADDQSTSISALGLRTLATNTLMLSPADRLRLAEEVIEFGKELA